MEKGRITLIPTPIGNLKDITLRSLDNLRSCDLVLAEDTRHTGTLLNHLEISKPIESLHQNNEHKRVQSLVERISSEGIHVTYCTDAGTPGISDPGFLLVRTALENGVDVECLPGPTALIPALVVSGLPNDRFLFEGFLPHKKGRRSRLEAIANEEKTVVLYESTHRILKLLNELKEVCESTRLISVSRELTKIHETHYRGTIADVINQLESDSTKGEFVVVLSGRST